MIENMENIHSNVDELSKFFNFFNKKEIKKNIHLDLKNVKNELEQIPVLTNDIKSLNIENKDLNTQYEEHKEISEKEKISLKSELEKRNELFTDLNIKHELISKLLAASSKNEGLKDFKKILKKDYLEFTKNVSSLSNEAEMYLSLKSIEKELELITADLKLQMKNTIAVGGGFSSGKSEFISSFFNNTKKLPIGMEPTTAIPTYVMKGNKQELKGCTNKGGSIKLQEIDKDIQLKLSHKFIKSFAFNLKEIMPFMVLETNLDYEYICFIDTPGYNPADADEGFTEDDIKTSKEFLSNATIFLWLIGADSNGTIPASDLDFLSELELDSKKVYVLFNKADLRSSSDIEDILDEIEDSLSDYDIEIVGLSAYSSINKEEYSYRKLPLLEFINNCNIESNVHKSLIERLYKVHRVYKYAMLKAIKEKEAIKSELHSASLDLLEEGFDDMTNPVYKRLDNLKKVFNIELHQNNLKELDKVIKNFKEAIDKVFKKESKIDLKDIKDDEIEINYDFTLDDISEEEIAELEKPELKKKKENIYNSDFGLKSENKSSSIEIVKAGGFFGMFGNK